MILNIEEIRNITTGAVNIFENSDGISFHRFSSEQEEYYEKASKKNETSFYDRCFATAGIRLMFKTNSRTLKLKGSVKKRTSRNYYSFDIYVDGKEFEHIDNFSSSELPEDYTVTEFPLNEFSGEFMLSDGIKEVWVYLPWSVEVSLSEMSIDDGSFLEPVRREKKLLAFGDSITQGYDALRPSLRYVSRLADMLGAEEINKGIGGEFFVPELVRYTENFVPDYITVAYGTNDWSAKNEEDFKIRCKSFFEILNENYPKSKIFAITPVWRADYQGRREFGSFEDVGKGIEKSICGLENVFLISGFNLITHNQKYFADLRLHPNDEGFREYSENLYVELLNAIQKE